MRLGLDLSLKGQGAGGAAPETIPWAVWYVDWGSDCDDAAAGLLLIHAHLAGEIKLKAAVCQSSGDGTFTCPSLVAFLTAYGVGTIPVYKCSGGPGDTYATQIRNSSFGIAAGVNTKTNADYVDHVAPVRSILAAAPSSWVRIVSTGPMQGPAALRASTADGSSALNGNDLILAKSEFLSQMAGDYPSQVSENNIANDAAGATDVANNWPVPVYWAPFGGATASASNPAIGPSLFSNFATDPLRSAYNAHIDGGSGAIVAREPKKRPFDPLASMVTVFGPTGTVAGGTIFHKAGANGTQTIVTNGNAWTSTTANDTYMGVDRTNNPGITGGEYQRYLNEGHRRLLAMEISPFAQGAANNWFFNLSEGSGDVISSQDDATMKAHLGYNPNPASGMKPVWSTSGSRNILTLSGSTTPLSLQALGVAQNGLFEASSACGGAIVKFTNLTASRQSIMGNNYAVAGLTGIRFQVTSAGALQIVTCVSNVVSFPTIGSANGAVTSGTWFGLTWSIAVDGTTRVFINGVEVTSGGTGGGTMDTGVHKDNPFLIGCSRDRQDTGELTEPVTGAIAAFAFAAGTTTLTTIHSRFATILAAL